MNRRQFFKTSILSALGVAALGTLKATQAWAAELVKMNKDGSAANPVAKGMGYVDDLKKALASKDIMKASGLDMAKMKAKKTAPKKQLCSDCQFYTAGAKAKTGPCTLFGGALVQGAGSCNTWVKRA